MRRKYPQRQHLSRMLQIVLEYDDSPTDNSKNRVGEGFPRINLKPVSLDHNYARSQGHVFLIQNALQEGPSRQRHSTSKHARGQINKESRTPDLAKGTQSSPVGAHKRKQSFNTFAYSGENELLLHQIHPEELNYFAKRKIRIPLKSKSLQKVNSSHTAQTAQLDSSKELAPVNTFCKNVYKYSCSLCSFSTLKYSLFTVHAASHATEKPKPNSKNYQKRRSRKSKVLYAPANLVRKVLRTRPKNPYYRGRQKRKNRRKNQKFDLKSSIRNCKLLARRHTSEGAEVPVPATLGEQAESSERQNRKGNGYLCCICLKTCSGLEDLRHHYSESHEKLRPTGHEKLRPTGHEAVGELSQSNDHNYCQATSTWILNHDERSDQSEDDSQLKDLQEAIDAQVQLFNQKKLKVLKCPCCNRTFKKLVPLKYHILMSHENCRIFAREDQNNNSCNATKKLGERMDISEKGLTSDIMDISLTTGPDDSSCTTLLTLQGEKDCPLPESHCSDSQVFELNDMNEGQTPPETDDDDNENDTRKRIFLSPDKNRIFIVHHADDERPYKLCKACGYFCENDLVLARHLDTAHSLPKVRLTELRIWTK